MQPDWLEKTSAACWIASIQVDSSWPDMKSEKTRVIYDEKHQ